MKSLCLALAFSFVFPAFPLQAQGRVYLVLGSDTAIWDGMNVSRYNCTYTLTLYTDPARNATRVMDPAFRSPLTDSYGTPVKLTWWMMAGNIFRRATNTNIPHPNTMTLHLIKKYQGTLLRMWGDELSLHYHTFVWTDYDGDGKYYWNQARTFAESAEDFDVTLAEMLLEEETFPVSFRSGWHAMDNGWQRRLDSLLLYSMHNDWPSRRTDTTEPLDNTYDWSRAPSAFVPFHPSPSDYQVPGSCRGWNLRSEYMAVVDSAFMASVFAAAAAGVDQVVCLWAHLPETDFLDNVRRVDAATHRAALRYPAIPFRYCTAVEAMQRWRGSDDTTRPQITAQEIPEGSMVRWRVTSDEPLFQPSPFVATKDRYGITRVLPCQAVNNRTWETTAAVLKADLAATGVAATDTVGNLSLLILRTLPDDIIIDDADPGYREILGTWLNAGNAAWGTTARQSTLSESDSSRAEWQIPIVTPLPYNIYVRVPALSTPARAVRYDVREGSTVLFSRQFTAGIPPDTWHYLGTTHLSPGPDHAVVLSASGRAQPGTQVPADAVKVSALVKQRWLLVPDAVHAGEVIVKETNALSLQLGNEGIEPILVTDARSTGGNLLSAHSLPLTVPPMDSTMLALTILPSAVGPFIDTLILSTDDPHHARVVIPVRGEAREYFVIVDDHDTASYSETGSWHFSVAQAFGSSSRYAYPAPGVSAAFGALLKKGGIYTVQGIVPTTVNASTRARYRLFTQGIPVDSAFLDQNSGSGAWTTIMEHAFNAGSEVALEITDAMSPVIPGKVLRADAVRFQWLSDLVGDTPLAGTSPVEFGMSQNYPNPFNPLTTFTIGIAARQPVTVTVFDMLGREVEVLLDAVLDPGRYTISWDATGAASGMYLCRLKAGALVQERKLVLLR